MSETMKYIFENYPDLFMRGRMGKIYLSDPLKSIYDGQLNFIELSNHVIIEPFDGYVSNHFTFYIILPNSSISSVERAIYLNDDVVLTDQQCVLFFNYKILLRYSDTSYGRKFINYDRNEDI